MVEYKYLCNKLNTSGQKSKNIVFIYLVQIIWEPIIYQGIILNFQERILAPALPGEAPGPHPNQSARGGNYLYFHWPAIILAAVNIFGGFLVTQRMLAMYKKKKKDK